MSCNLVKMLVVVIFMLLLQLPVISKAALPGDINGDGVVSISEVQTVINAFLGLIKDNSASTSSIVGVWRAVNGAGFNYLILFSDNTFVYAENDVSAPVTDNGVEVGTYTSTGTNITFSITFDHNGPGQNSGIGELGIPKTYDYVLSNNGNTFTGAGGQLVMNRVIFNSTSIVGVWRAIHGAGFNYLILFSDNTFVYAENDVSAPVTDNGVEVGTYTNNGTNITFNVVFDRNGPGANSGVGEIGIPSVINYVLSNNGNTLTVGGGQTALSRAF